MWGGMIVATMRDLVIAGFAIVTVLISAQAFFFLYLILYAWNEPDTIEKNKSPKRLIEPRFSFTALLPARHEEAVIGETIAAIANIDYPEEMKELLVLVRGDDRETLEAAQRVMDTLGRENIKLVVVNDTPVNKPNQLNWGLYRAKNEVVAIFDAEDQPHPDIYKIVNTVMVREGTDVVQSGVQLVNYRSSWFAAFNVLEYYFWFKSALHFFARQGVVPLGGNTVFFKRVWLNRAGGWDEKCLTEDAEIGIRLSKMGARIAVVYDEEHATAEETPVTLSALVRQRTRWNMGFLQVLGRGEWKGLPKWNQRILTGYLLVLPEILVGVLLVAPILAWAGAVYGLGIPLAMFSYVPLGLLIMQLVVAVTGMWQFTRDYKLIFPWWMGPMLVAGFWPYIVILAIGALRAVWRLVVGNLMWEKTTHVNAHRVDGLGYAGVRYGEMG